MKMSNFQLIVTGIFAFFIIAGVAVFAFFGGQADRLRHRVKRATKFAGTLHQGVGASRREGFGPPTTPQLLRFDSSF